MTTLETIPFHGDNLLVAEIDEVPHIVLRPAFEAIGLDADRQIMNMKAQVWATTSVTAVVAADGKTRDMATADLRSFLMQLATIPASRVAEHVRPKLVDYQCEVARVIEAHFTGSRHHLTVPNTQGSTHRSRAAGDTPAPGEYQLKQEARHESPARSAPATPNQPKERFDATPQAYVPS